jgi:hypothetical protein
MNSSSVELLQPLRKVARDLWLVLQNSRGSIPTALPAKNPGVNSTCCRLPGVCRANRSIPPIDPFGVFRTVSCGHHRTVLYSPNTPVGSPKHRIASANRLCVSRRFARVNSIAVADDRFALDGRFHDELSSSAAFISLEISRHLQTSSWNDLEHVRHSPRPPRTRAFSDTPFSFLGFAFYITLNFTITGPFRAVSCFIYCAISCSDCTGNPASESRTMTGLGRRPGSHRDGRSLCTPEPVAQPSGPRAGPCTGSE